MKDFNVDVDPANVDPNGLCDGNSSAITQLLIDGALATSFDLDGIADGNASTGAAVTMDGVLAEGGYYADKTGIARHIYILDESANDQTGATYTLTGTDENDLLQEDSFAGPGSGLFVISALRFKSVTAIVISSPAASSTVDVGTMGHFTSADGLAHRLNITDTATQVQTDSTFTFTGTDADGRAQTESRAGPGSGATVETTKYFLTVSNIVISGSPDSGDTVDIGTVDEVASATIPLDWYAPEVPIMHVDVTGTISVDVQVTLKNPFKINDAAPFNVDDQEGFAWLNDANFTAKTADLMSPLAMRGVKAMRLVTNSYTDTAEAQVYVSQPRNRY